MSAFTGKDDRRQAAGARARVLVDAVLERLRALEEMRADDSKNHMELAVILGRLEAALDMEAEALVDDDLTESERYCLGVVAGDYSFGPMGSHQTKQWRRDLAELERRGLIERPRFEDPRPGFVTTAFGAKFLADSAVDGVTLLDDHAIRRILDPDALKGEGS